MRQDLEKLLGRIRREGSLLSILATRIASCAYSKLVLPKKSFDCRGSYSQLEEELKISLDIFGGYKFVTGVDK
jgi:hypothetical protein